MRSVPKALGTRLALGLGCLLVLGSCLIVAGVHKTEWEATVALERMRLLELSATLDPAAVGGPLGEEADGTWARVLPPGDARPGVAAAFSTGEPAVREAGGRLYAFTLVQGDRPAVLEVSGSLLEARRQRAVRTAIAVVKLLVLIALVMGLLVATLRHLSASLQRTRTLTDRRIAGLEAEVGDCERQIAQLVRGQDERAAVRRDELQEMRDEIHARFEVGGLQAEVELNDVRYDLVTMKVLGSLPRLAYGLPGLLHVRMSGSRDVVTIKIVTRRHRDGMLRAVPAERHGLSALPEVLRRIVNRRTAYRLRAGTRRSPMSGTLYVEGRSEPLHGRVEDLSPLGAGLMIDASADLLAGLVHGCELRIQLPGYEERVCIPVSLQHVDPVGLSCRVGVKFLRLGDGVGEWTAALEEWVMARQRALAG